MNCGSLRATRRLLRKFQQVADRCASSRVQAAVEAQAKLQADCGVSGSRVQCRADCGDVSRVQRSGVTATDLQRSGVTATDLQHSGVTATELQCSGVSATEEWCPGVTTTELERQCDCTPQKRMQVLCKRQARNN